MDLKHAITGIHHVTATVGDAREDYEFYTALLGLRLVKKTVNFDDHDVYHFYYGNENGAPGTIMTTFPYGRKGVRQGIKGTGQVAVTTFSIPEGAIPFWENRLAAAGLVVREERLLSHNALFFDDPSGLELALIENTEDDRRPWESAVVDARQAIRGFYSVILSIQDVQPTYRFLEDVFGAEVHAEDGNIRRYRLGEGGPGAFVDVRHDPDVDFGYNGIGTVHHVAFRIADHATQQAFRGYLEQKGVRVTPIMDRNYFTSIYFRMPGYVLFEVATNPPGFLIDEPAESLGQHLKLPAWEEPNRKMIEAVLPEIN